MMLAQALRNAHVLIDSSAISKLDAFNEFDISAIDVLTQCNVNVLVTPEVVCEVLQTPVRDRRGELVKILRGLPNLAIARQLGDILKTAAYRYIVNGELRYKDYVSDFSPDEALVRASRRQTVKWARRAVTVRSEWYPTMLKSVRQHLQTHASDFSVGELRDYFRILLADIPTLEDKYFLDLFEKIGMHVQLKGRTTDLLARSPAWQAMSVAMAASGFRAALSERNFGKRKVPGSIDAMQMAYLPACDFFICRDKGLSALARLVIRRTNQIRCHVITPAEVCELGVLIQGRSITPSIRCATASSDSSTQYAIGRDIDRHLH